MIAYRSNLTRLASCTLLIAFLLAGMNATSALAQDYKKVYNEALAAATAKNYTLARAKFAEAAPMAQSAGDSEIAKKSKYVAAQIDYKLGNSALKAENFDQALKHYKAGAAMYTAYIKNQYG